MQCYGNQLHSFMKIKTSVSEICKFKRVINTTINKFHHQKLGKKHTKKEYRMRAHKKAEKGNKLKPVKQKEVEYKIESDFLSH